MSPPLSSTSATLYRPDFVLRTAQEFKTTQYEAVCILTIKGRFLGSIERDAWQQIIDDLKAAGRTQLVIDLAKAAFMDSTGAGLIARAAETLREAGGDACLAGVQTQVKNIFVITRLLGRMFDDHPTVEAVLESFAERLAAPVASGRN